MSASTNQIPWRWRPILLFSSLCGALAIALALSLPAVIAQRETVHLIVYGATLVTLLTQGYGMKVWTVLRPDVFKAVLHEPDQEPRQKPPT